MTENKKTVTKYMDGFRSGDHQKVLSCLTEDIIWDMPGYFQLNGKEEFDGEIENDAFEGHPIISIIRLVEENNIVIAEGTVQGNRKDGGQLDAVFCDVFHMENARIRKLTSYLMNK